MAFRSHQALEAVETELAILAIVSLHHPVRIKTEQISGIQLDEAAFVGGLRGRTEDRTASPPARTVMATAWAITGTGPDLVVVARESMRTADYSRIYLGSRVTGTGPGLLQVASDFSVPKVTGTGPDLVQVAEESRRASGAWSR